MSHKSTKQGNGRQGEPQAKKPEIEAAKVQVSGSVIVAVIGGIVTVLTTLIGVLAANDYFKPALSPTVAVTSIPMTATLTVSPTLTEVSPSPIPSDTPAPTYTIAPTQVENIPVPCLWRSYSDGEVESPTESECLDDVTFGGIGISDLGEGKLDFSVSNSQRGIYGMLLPLGPVAQIKRGFEYVVRLNIKELATGRFFVALSPNPRPDVQSAYAIVINPDAGQLVMKYFFYKANEIPEQIVSKDKPKINAIQGVNYTIKFVISYPNLAVDVNNGIFRPKAQQIGFNGVGYIFIGYQRISSETARTRVGANVQLP
jgi:hypothetical protein